MASPLEKLTLDQLYDRNLTPKVLSLIQSRDDFSSINKRYCEKACTLKCKASSSQVLAKADPKNPVDVLILLDHHALNEKYKKYADIDSIYRGIFQFLKNKYLPDLNVQVIYAFKCPIDFVDTRVNGRQPPTFSNLKRCGIYARNEIMALKPKVTIATSSLAARIVGVEASRGEIVDHPELGKVIVSMHPRILCMIRQNSSGANWGPDFLSLMELDFQKAANIVNGSLTVPKLADAIEEAKKVIHIARSMEEVRTYIDQLRGLFVEGYEASYDLETTSLDPWAEDARIITVQFGIELPDGVIHAYVFPAWHRNNIWYNPDEMWDEMKDIIEHEEYPKIGHNIKFDAVFTQVRTGTRVGGIQGDTMLYLHNINSGLQGNYGLKAAVWDWLPETGLGGYEDNLPSITRVRNAAVEDEELSIE